MKLTLAPEGLTERFALELNLAPVPVAQAFFGMMGARIAMAGVRLGLFASLAEHGATSASTLAERLELHPAGTRHLLDGLLSLELVTYEVGAYALTRRARRWLDPASPRYVGDFLEFNYDQWEWWSRLEEAVRTGEGTDLHHLPPDDPVWGRYARAMFQLARLAAPEVSRRIALPSSAKSVLDLGGCHGWFAADLCRRRRGRVARVVDLPGACATGRTLIAEAGMAERVSFKEGDLFEADLGGPHDAALCFQVLHHLSPTAAVALLRRAREALAPGGRLAILEYLVNDEGTPDVPGAMLGLHYFLTSSATTVSLLDLRRWLHQAGFVFEKAHDIRRLPLQTLILARASG